MAMSRASGTGQPAMVKGLTATGETMCSKNDNHKLYIRLMDHRLTGDYGGSVVEKRRASPRERRVTLQNLYAG